MNEMIEQIINDIVKLETLSIPCVSNGLPYVRLDQIAEIFWMAGINAAPINDRISEVISKFKNDQIDVH